MLTDILENVLNRGLPRSPRAQQLCAELAGRRVALEMPDIARLVVESSGRTLRLVRDTAPADAELIAGPFSLLALAAEPAQRLLQRGDVQVRGDVELAQRFQELARLLRPDLEEELSLVIGDVPAHQLGRLARLTLGWTRAAAATTRQNIAEYLGYESRDLVPRPEADQFLRGVDLLREDVDRLEARLALLMQRHGAP